ncbi:unnamed protein product [Linum trigynum]|uniref:Uncharacterized protein n=1 Tax=Linum trigynum TaxID=586398 RepID=A0AAV2CEY6_9ROSI
MPNHHRQSQLPEDHNVGTNHCQTISPQKDPARRRRAYPARPRRAYPVRQRRADRAAPSKLQRRTAPAPSKSSFRLASVVDQKLSLMLDFLHNNSYGSRAGLVVDFPIDAEKKVQGESWPGFWQAKCGIK